MPNCTDNSMWRQSTVMNKKAVFVNAKPHISHLIHSYTATVGVKEVMLLQVMSRTGLDACF